MIKVERVAVAAAASLVRWWASPNAAISKFERGKNPSFSRATDIAIALGCTLDELAGIGGEAT